MNTHRAYHGATTTLTAWARTDTGKRDMTGDTLVCTVYRYGQTTDLTTLPVTSPAAGKLSVTVSEDATETYLSHGLYRFAITADGAVVYDGLLEIV